MHLSLGGWISRAYFSEASLNIINPSSTNAVNWAVNPIGVPKRVIHMVDRHVGDILPLVNCILLTKIMPDFADFHCCLLRKRWDQNSGRWLSHTYVVLVYRERPNVHSIPCRGSQDCFPRFLVNHTARQDAKCVANQ
jgi:hypothetical protein